MSFTKFSDYEYVRPDMDALNTCIRNSAISMKNAASKEEAVSAFQTVFDAWKHLDTLKNVCEIRNTLDTSDPFYEKEMNYLYETVPQAELVLQNFQKEVLASPYLPKLKEIYGDLYFERMEKLMCLVHEENVENTIEEKKLIQRYHKAAAAPVVEFINNKAEYPYPL